MIITQKRLARRTFLKGIGVSIGLPMLEAMSPALALGRSAAAPKTAIRLAFVYVPNGIVMNQWTPKAAGKDFEFTRILKPLEPFREDLLVITGLASHNGNA